MKKFLYVGAILALLVLGTGLRTVDAADGEVINWFRLLETKLNTIQFNMAGNQEQNGTRLDTVETKLDRIYEACGRGTTAARRVTLAQVNTCIDACFTTAAIGPASQGAVDKPRFVACVSRCPSNTLRNIECATTYVNYATIGGSVRLETGEVVQGALSPSAFARQCAQYQRAPEPMCRVFGDLFRSNLGACLFDQAANTCQSDCQRNYRNDAGYIFCQLRCQNRTRATERFEQLQDAGFLDEEGRLRMTVSDAAISPLAPTTQLTNPTTPSTSVTAPAPATETFSQCVYRCDNERTACLERNAKSAECQPTYEACYSGCSSKRS